jgi:hypothetical protein
MSSSWQRMDDEEVPMGVVKVPIGRQDAKKVPGAAREVSDGD